MADNPPIPGRRGAASARAATAAKDQPSSPSEAARLADPTPGISGTPGSGPAATARPRAARTPNLQAKLEQFFAIPAMAFAAGGDTYSAEILALRGPMVAEAWYELSKQNATVKRMLEALVEGSAWGGVIFSTLSVVVPIAKHKGMYRGPDPFAFMLEGPSVAPNEHAASGSQPKGMTWSKPSGGPASAPFTPPAPGGEARPGGAPSGDDEAIVQYLEGAPPGVVTVAASAAQHQGAQQ